MDEAGNRCAINVRIERKQELMQLCNKTGIQMASLVRSWIYEKLDEAKRQEAK